MLGYLSRHAVEHLRGNIGRVTHNERELAHEAFPHRRAQIALKHGDALSQVQSRHVLFRKRDCLGGNIAGQHARFRIFESNRARNAARTRANIGDIQHVVARGIGPFASRLDCGICDAFDLVFNAHRPILALQCSIVHTRRLKVRFRCGFRLQLLEFIHRKSRIQGTATFGGGQKSQCLAHEHFRFRTRNEHAFAHLHGDMAEGHLACDVLKRLARAPASYPIAQCSALIRGKRAFKIDVQLDATHMTRLAQKPLGRKARVFVALALKVAAAPIERRLNSPHLVGHFSLLSLRGKAPRSATYKEGRAPSYVIRPIKQCIKKSEAYRAS